MALFIWCLGIAMIYPPGALIVVLAATNHTENRNMSVMNPPVPRDLEFLDKNTVFPTLGNIDLDCRAGNVDDPTVNGSFMYLHVSLSTLRTSLIIIQQCSRCIDQSCTIDYNEQPGFRFAWEPGREFNHQYAVQGTAVPMHRLGIQSFYSPLR
ncbi:hypothetical protein IG631_19166 [Alternaria alternata]|nr:hypothetical protein IG631_19166 [Alternaria alternata]